MNIPAYTSPTLCIGRTFNAENSTAAGDLFPAGIPTKTINVDKFSFKYAFIEDSRDVNALLELSGDVSLRIKADLLKVEGVGQYINKTKKKEGTTTLLAVMKCTTVIETIDGDVKPLGNLVGAETHYVRSVIYGAELVAKLQFTSSSTQTRGNIKGRVEGGIPVQAANAGLKAKLNSLTSECNSASDLQVDYYATGLPNKLPMDIAELNKMIEEFPSRLKDINNGKGVPIKFELLPLTTIIPEARSYLQERLQGYELDEMEKRFDDIRTAQDLANEFIKSRVESHEDVVKFITDTSNVEKVFRQAIRNLGKEGEMRQVEASHEAYENALNGACVEGKFVHQWKKIQRSKIPTTSIKLPGGKELSIVLLGKTGNGKSKTGNSILGRMHFKSSAQANSLTKSCSLGQRKDERAIDVIDTPGVLDNAAVLLMDKTTNMLTYLRTNGEVQKEILREVARIFAMAPDGFDCFIIVTKYGTRFTSEDCQALKLLQQLLGKEALDNMILVLTHGDQAERHAEENKETKETTLKNWLESLPSWVKEFIAEIKDRVFLFNNCLSPEKEPEKYKKQLSSLIKMIDEMTSGRERFVHKLTHTSKEVLVEQITKALDDSGINEQLKAIQEEERKVKEQQEELRKNEEEANRRAEEEKQQMERQRKELENDKKKQQELKAEIARRDEEQKKQAEKVRKQEEEVAENAKRVAEQKKRIEADERKLKEEEKRKQKESGGEATSFIQRSVGGCYPGSATFKDIHGRARRIDCLKVGDKVQVVTKQGISLEPVVTFIHRQPELMQEFLKITTLKKKFLHITEDHLLFVTKGGQPSAIPARDVSIGDIVYVRGDQGELETDAVQSISSVYEKGAYAPVTLSGSILINDVHTSCYFDVLSHEWSHRAMGIARVIYHVSPWMVQWLSSIGQEDGFPGWCRLALKILT